VKRNPKILHPLGSAWATETVTFPVGGATRQSVALAPVNGAFTYGALSRAQEGAGIATTTTAITGGDPSGHWQISNGRLYPSIAGDAAELSAGPYALELDDGTTQTITIEANTWDVATQSEWDFVATQSAATLAGKKIALRNTTTINLGITGVPGTPFRRDDYRDVSNNPCVVEGRFGAPRAWDDYCRIDKVATMRGARGVTFKHLRTTPVAESKFVLLGESANVIDDITIDDCWISGAVGDPYGDYADSTNYPNNAIDIVKTAGSANNSVGSITVKNCLVQWGGTLINLRVDLQGSEVLIEGNEVRYFADDGIAVAMAADGSSHPVTIRSNLIYGPISKPTDSAGAHPDAIRLLGNANATADWTDILIEYNVCLQGLSRGDTQAIFLDDMRTQALDSGFFFVATIRHNITAISTAPHGIWVMQAKNCLIDQNTVVSWGAASGANQTPSILIGPGTTTGTSGGGNTISNCIADAIGTSAGALTLTNNRILGQNGAIIPYIDVFDGPTFTPATLAEALTVFATKVAAGGAGANVDLIANPPAPDPVAPVISGASITGTAENGGTLTASATITGDPTPTVAYQWQKIGTNISGETSQTITLDESGMSLSNGNTISCEITATNIAGSNSAEPTISYVATATGALVVPATSAYFQDPSNIPASTSRITFRGTFNLPSLSASSPGTALFNSISTPMRLTVQADGAINARVEDSTGAALIDAQVAPAGTFTVNTDHAIVFDGNLATNTVTVTVNGTNYSNTLTTGTGVFPTSRAVQFLSGGAAPLVPSGSIISNLSVDYNGTQRKAISNDAATANADAWHVGANFTQAP